MDEKDLFAQALQMAAMTYQGYSTEIYRAFDQAVFVEILRLLRAKGDTCTLEDIMKILQEEEGREWITLQQPLSAVLGSDTQQLLNFQHKLAALLQMLEAMGQLPVIVGAWKRSMGSELPVPRLIEQLAQASLKQLTPDAGSQATTAAVPQADEQAKRDHEEVMRVISARLGEPKIRKNIGVDVWLKELVIAPALLEEARCFKGALPPLMPGLQGVYLDLAVVLRHLLFGKQCATVSICIQIGWGEKISRLYAAMYVLGIPKKMDWARECVQRGIKCSVRGTPTGSTPSPQPPQPPPPTPGSAGETSRRSPVRKTRIRKIFENADAERKAITTLLHERLDLSSTEVANELGLSVSSLRKRCAALGIETREELFEKRPELKRQWARLREGKRQQGILRKRDERQSSGASPKASARESSPKEDD